MPTQTPLQQRVFKTAWFAKAAKKALISDLALCKAIHEVMLGQADDLGGAVYKKRLNNNQTRSIILAKVGQFWVYAYLFAKKDRDNIDDNELASFRKLARSYAGLTGVQLSQLIQDEQFVEICHGKQAKI
jgi:hypothetical protein